METYEPSLLVGFDEEIKTSAPLKVYLWLEQLPRGTRLWEALDPLLTDFFYSNH